MPRGSFKDGWPNYIPSDTLFVSQNCWEVCVTTHRAPTQGSRVSWAVRMNFIRLAYHQSDLLSLFSFILVVGLLWSKKGCKSNNILLELFFSGPEPHHLDKLWSVRKVGWEFLLKAVSKSLKLRAFFFFFLPCSESKWTQSPAPDAWAVSISLCFWPNTKQNVETANCTGWTTQKRCI